MTVRPLVATVALLSALTLAACSSDDDDAGGDADGTSQFNPDLQGPDTSGQPGGDTSALAGLYDGSETAGEATDEVLWDLADNGVLTAYDYQQDGAEGATGENCYLVGDPITVTPEDGDTYTIGGTAATVTLGDSGLAIEFTEADANDFDEDGDTTEMPNLLWPAVTDRTLTDLNACDG